MLPQAAIFGGSRGTRRGGSEVARLTPLRPCKLEIWRFWCTMPHRHLFSTYVYVLFYMLCFICLLVLDSHIYFSHKPELSFHLHICITANHENNLLLMAHILYTKKSLFFYYFFYFYFEFSTIFPNFHPNFPLDTLAQN